MRRQMSGLSLEQRQRRLRHGLLAVGIDCFPVESKIDFCQFWTLSHSVSISLFVDGCGDAEVRSVWQLRTFWTFRQGAKRQLSASNRTDPSDRVFWLQEFQWGSWADPSYSAHLEGERVCLVVAQIQQVSG